MGAVAVASFVLHGAVFWLLLPPGVARPGVESPPTIEIEMIDQAAEVKGAADASPAPPPTQPPPPAPPAPDLPKEAAGEAVLPPPAPPAPPTQEATPGPPTSLAPQAPAQHMAVNLGNADEDRDPLLVTGPDVVPPRPDARVRNKPPAYPADAARRGARGTVGLRVRVTETGIPAWVEVVESSGDASLDRSAQEAVSLWQFQPARNGGAAVAFDYDIAIRFTMSGR